MRNMTWLAALVLAAPLWAEITLSRCEEVGQWQGGPVVDTTQVKEGKAALRWELARSVRLTLADLPHDWTGGNALSFWAYSPVATGDRFWIVLPSEDPTAPGMDYYAVVPRIDFTGWRRYVLPFAEMGKTRQPVGWQKIEALTFHAAWDPNITPDPRSVLILDDLKVITVSGSDRGPRMTDEEFYDALDLARPGLETVQAAVQRQNYPAAAEALAAYLRQRTKPTWLTDFRTRPAPAEKVNTANADKVLDHEFTFIKTTYRPPGRIDWSHNAMTEGESATIEWNAQFNRHFHFEPVVEAHWNTGQQKYAQELANQMVAWIEDCPVLLWQSGNSPYHHAWETLNTGIRISSTWPNALFRCLDSPAFSSSVLVTILKSWHEQTEHLVRWPSTNNWLTCESCGVFYAGILWPEFKRAPEWRRIAMERLYGQLDHEVYPDGLQTELALGYNNWVVDEFAQVLKVARHNDLLAAVPADYQEKLEKMYNYQLLAMRPDGKLWGLNDSGDASPLTLLKQAAEYFPQRPDFQWAATQGQKGGAPPPASVAFPYAGHYVMRSGWQPQDLHLLLDAGPWGTGHQHEDKLGVLAYAYGQPLLIEGGVYMYDKSRWRRYVLSTRAHNTIRVDDQEQRNSSERGSYVLPYPFQPLPNPWFTTPEADFVEGTYEFGYGTRQEKKADVTHRRSVFFLKPEYWIVVDTMTPADGKSHDYEAIFHLNATEAAAEGLRVSTRNAAANLHLVPWSQPDLRVEIVRGKEEELVQGWANQPWRPVPTALYRWQSAVPNRQVFALYPTPAGQTCPVRQVLPMPVTTPAGQPAAAVAVRIEFSDGRVHTYCAADEGAGQVRFGDYLTDGRGALVALDAAGQVTRQVVLGGKVLERR